jgi:hypothetical protein
MVNTCQKIYSNPPAIYQKMMMTTLPCTPARVENSTGTAKAARVTGTNARLPKNSAILVAAHPIIHPKESPTAAAMGHGASDPIADPVTAMIIPEHLLRL